MNGIVELQGVFIGEGRPKICVPVMGASAQEVRSAALCLDREQIDLVEWRADSFEGLMEMEQVTKVLCMLRSILGNLPLLFTIRTRAEGGEAEISIEDYVNINIEAAKSGCVDLIDVETARGDDVAFLIIEAAHECGVKVIGSYHDFQKTPKKEDMIMRLCKMQEVEADIAKIAVMPKSSRDVLTLLDATLAMKELHRETPVVTMAMGDLGKVTRISGELFGSAITFGTVGKASAPGQMPIEALNTCMEYLKTSCFVDEK